MARHSKRRTTDAKTNDSFQNFRASLGVGANALMSGGTYGFNPVTRNRVMLEFAYRGSWVVRAAVKTIADDMTREGIELTSDIDPDDIAQLLRGFSRLKVWQAFNENVCWARLYGGSVGVIMIDGQKMDTPLRVETISKGQFRGICVLDRWMVQPTMGQLITTLGPELGKPVYYDVIGDSQKLPNCRIHHSRVIRLEGDDLPYYQRVSENGWGLSVLEPLYDQLIAFDSATAGTGQLVFKAHLRTLKIAKMREILAGLGGPKAKEALLEQMNNIRQFQSSEGLTVLDGSDEFETHQYSFSGLSDVLQQFAQHLCGALGIPFTRLFGASASGLNATGQGDLQNYYDSVKQKQEDELRTDILKILTIMHYSILGRAPTKQLDFEFVSLWQMDENAKADIAQKNTTTIVTAVQDGVVSRKIGLEELKQQSTITGIWTNISQKDIDEAANDPPPQAQMPAPPNAELSPGMAAPSQNQQPATKAIEGPMPAAGTNASQTAAAPVNNGLDPHGMHKLIGLQ